jgi:hypothetical protein
VIPIISVIESGVCGVGGLMVWEVGGKGWIVIVVIVSEGFGLSVLVRLGGKLVLAVDLVFFVFLFEIIEGAHRLFERSFLDTEPVSGTLPHKEGLLRLLDCESSLHDHEGIPILLSFLDELLAAFRVVALGFQLVPLTFIPAFLPLAMCAFLVGSVKLELLAKVI